MKKSIFIIYAIATLILLVSSLLAPAQISQNKNIFTSKDNLRLVPNLNILEDIDQSQTTYIEGQFLPVGRIPLPDLVYNIYSGQSFIPTLNVLSRVELYVGKNGTTTYPLTVALRDNLTHDNLVEASVPPEQIVTENFSWISWDLPDIKLTPGETYYIIGYTQNVTDNWYAWGGNYDRYSYPYGCAWASIDEGNTWTNDSTNDQTSPAAHWCGTPTHTRTNESDMCFITYGYNNQPPGAPDITGTINGKAGVEYTYNFTVIDPEGNDIYLYVDWGDSCPAINWSGPYTSGIPIQLDHAFEQRGDYTIGAQAKDIFDEEGSWGYLAVSMPTSYFRGNTQSLLLKARTIILTLFK